MTIAIFDLRDVPLYDADVEALGDPPGVAAFKEAIRAADALLVATPEYQHGVPGVLKNALDWASRPPATSAFHGKTVAIAGASPSMTGTARAQTQLRDVLVYNDTYAVCRPEVLIAAAHKKFDAGGRLTDEFSRTLLAQLLAKLMELTLTLRAGRAAVVDAGTP